jgi:hypothetical protein
MVAKECRLLHATWMQHAPKGSPTRHLARTNWRRPECVQFLHAHVVFTATQALAASPKVEAAIKVFAAIADDPEKLRLFCRFVDAGDNEARSNRLIRRLGADFKSAWEVRNGLDKDSEDGKAYFSAMDDLENECPDDLD